MSTNKVSAQNKLSVGSFVRAITSEGDLKKNKMYRVKTVKQEGKYVIIDHLFCGTDELKGKTITFSGRFELLSETQVKTLFKKELKTRGFIDGQKFVDVRQGNEVSVDSSSRTHILAKFGKFMGVKIAGGHVWFAGKSWADPLVDTETIPEPTEEDATLPEPQSAEYWVLTPTKSMATHVANTFGRDEVERWVSYWDVYMDDTAYSIDRVSRVITGYADVELAESKADQIYTYEEWAKMQFPNEKKKKTKTRKTVSMTGGSIEEQILAVVDEHLDSTEARQHISNSVEKLLNGWGIDKNVRQLEVRVNDKPAVKVGKVHFKYDLVLKCMMARTNVALVGAAGSGKTTTVAKAAEALELKFYSKSVSAQTGAHEFFGYQDAQGRYVRTLFREAYEFGGVFLLDEFDAGNPNVLAALNQATANEHCAFADGMIPKHEDFICVMAGNTFGHGANSEYVGRNKIDAATLDRFAFIDFPYDEDLEYALATDKNWCKKVQAFRKKVEQKKIRTIVSPRATIIGGQLLSNGVSEKDVMELLIFKGLNNEERNLLK